MISRSDALALLSRHGVYGHLLEHSLAAEAVLKSLASHLEENEELWSLTGLLHDLDFPTTAAAPAEHGLMVADILADLMPGEAIQAIKCHNGEMNGNPPQCKFDYALRCGESVTGLIAAAALMRPTRYDGMNVKSIRKKFKDKAFAANVSRKNILECEQTGISLDDFLALAIEAMARLDAERGSQEQ